jgi:hypothetical protein
MDKLLQLEQVVAIFPRRWLLIGPLDRTFVTVDNGYLYGGLARAASPSSVACHRSRQLFGKDQARTSIFIAEELAGLKRNLN